MGQAARQQGLTIPVGEGTDLTADSAQQRATYRERAHLVAVLAAHHPAVIVPAEPEMPVLYLHTPVGQISWHLAPADLDLFEHVHQAPNRTTVRWDGHTKQEALQRLRYLAGVVAARD